jgi:FG-GAP-like repeat/FlgD Ig-like domain
MAIRSPRSPLIVAALIGALLAHSDPPAQSAPLLQAHCLVSRTDDREPSFIAVAPSGFGGPQSNISLIGVTNEYGLDDVSYFSGRGDGSFGLIVDQYFSYLFGVPIRAVALGSSTPQPFGRPLDFYIVVGSQLGIWIYPQRCWDDTLLNVVGGVCDVVLGDVTGDNFPEIVSVSDSGNALVTVKTTECGRLIGRRTQPAIGNPRAVAVGDLDSDGVGDVVAALRSADSVVVWHSLGNHTFAPPQYFPAGRRPHDVAIADFDGDGSLDVVVSNPETDSLTVLYGTGDGGLTRRGSAIATLHLPEEILATDLDGDGDPDLVATTGPPGYPDDQIVFHLNGGLGVMGPPMIRRVGPGPTSLVAGDFDGDGLNDVVVACRDSRSLAFLPGTPNGPRAEYTLSQGSDGSAVHFGTLDPEGHTAIVTGNASSLSLGIRRSTEAHTFGVQEEIPTGGEPRSFSIVDVDKDGFSDLVVAQGSMHIHWGSSAGFDDTTVLPSNDNSAWCAVGDFNEDGLLDVLGSGYYGTVLTLNAGNRTFSPPIAVTSLSSAMDFVSADFNVDGHEDFAELTWDVYSIANVYLGRGDGSFDEIPGVFGGGSTYFLPFVVGDVDKDGIPDLLFCDRLYCNPVECGDGTVFRITTGTGDGHFGEQGWAYDVGVGPGAIAVGDLNSDGFQDVALAMPNRHSVLVMLNNHGTGLVPEHEYLAKGLADVEIADVTGDGRNDVITCGAGEVWILTNGYHTLSAPEPPRRSTNTPATLSVYPSPFRDRTHVAFASPVAKAADVAVYDVSGRRVRLLHHGQLTAAQGRVVWNGTDEHGLALPSGIYFVKLTAGLETLSRRIALVR